MRVVILCSSKIFQFLVVPVNRGISVLVYQCQEKLSHSVVGNHPRSLWVAGSSLAADRCRVGVLYDWSSEVTVTAMDPEVFDDHLHVNPVGYRRPDHAGQKLTMFWLRHQSHKVSCCGNHWSCLVAAPHRKNGVVSLMISSSSSSLPHCPDQRLGSIVDHANKGWCFTEL